MENKVKIITAKVLKTAMDKSAVVSVERLVKASCEWEIY